MGSVLIGDFDVPGSWTDLGASGVVGTDLGARGADSSSSSSTTSVNLAGLFLTLPDLVTENRETDKEGILG